MIAGRIFSIGYGTQSADAVLERLTAAQIGYVIDVRSAPYSRFQPDFSRDQLERAVSQREMRYVFMGDLLGGRPKDPDCYSDGKVDYTKTRHKAFFHRGLERLKTAHAKGLNICMLCSEAHPSQCHRAKLIGAALLDQGIEVTHILPNGSHISQADVMVQLTKGQHEMFGEHFVSRNTYR